MCEREADVYVFVCECEKETESTRHACVYVCMEKREENVYVCDRDSKKDICVSEYVSSFAGGESDVKGHCCVTLLAGHDEVFLLENLCVDQNLDPFGTE